jgi:hypothetical protein
LFYKDGAEEDPKELKNFGRLCFVIHTTGQGATVQRKIMMHDGTRKFWFSEVIDVK